MNGHCNIESSHHAITEKKGEKLGQFRGAIPTVHGLRKFCTNTMKSVKLDSEYRKILTGHTIDVEDSYVMPRPEELLEAYLKVVDDLTINEENRLKTKVEVLEEKIAEIESLKAQVKKLRSLPTSGSTSRGEKASRSRLKKMGTRNGYLESSC